ncbi:MAG TPA: hypothetical protein ENK53_02805 [Thiotrichales bacterium]|nr:hypothetical protein [Thiotrichales bacterium]
MKPSGTDSGLPDPEAALGAYLDTLLGMPSRESAIASEAKAAEAWRRVLPLRTRHGRVLLPESRVEAVMSAVAIEPAPLEAPFVGLLDHAGRRSVCVDLAALLSTSSSVAREAAEECRHAVLIGDGRWALLCEATEDATTLDPETLRWRQAADGRRPWLVGVSHRLRSGLLDADELIRWLWRRLRSDGMSDAS